MRRICLLLNLQPREPAPLLRRGPSPLAQTVLLLAPAAGWFSSHRHAATLPARRSALAQAAFALDRRAQRRASAAAARRNQRAGTPSGHSHSGQRSHAAPDNCSTRGGCTRGLWRGQQVAGARGRSASQSGASLRRCRPPRAAARGVRPPRLWRCSHPPRPRRNFSW